MPTITVTEREAIKAAIFELNDGIVNYRDTTVKMSNGIVNLANSSAELMHAIIQDMCSNTALSNNTVALSHSVIYLVNICQMLKNKNTVLKSVIPSLVVLAIIHLIQYADKEIKRESDEEQYLPVASKETNTAW